jgi:hypothetical protein
MLASAVSKTGLSLRQGRANCELLCKQHADRAVSNVQDHTHKHLASGSIMISVISAPHLFLPVTKLNAGDTAFQMQR